MEEMRSRLDDRHVGLTLQNQLDRNAALRRAPHVTQQAVTREEIGIGDDNAVARESNRHPVVALDVLAVQAVVAHNKACVCARFALDAFACLAARSFCIFRRFQVAPTLPPAAQATFPRRLCIDIAANILHQRPFDRHRIVLLG